MKKNKQILGLMIVGALALTSCTQSKNDSKPTNQVKVADESIEMQVIQNLSKNVILATYQGLSDAAAELHAQVLVLEQNRTQANLDKAQAAWKKSRLYWESTESFLFGPVEALSIDPMIDTWPLNVPDLKAILNGGAPITAAVLRTSGANLKGFHTIEFLLFGDGLSSNTKAIANLTDREIEYLKATSEVLAEDTAKLTTAWTTQYDPDIKNSVPYVSIIMNPGFENEFYSSKHSVLIEFLNGMIGIADEVGNGKIAGPLGASVSEADPSAEESPFSWNSLTDFSNNIRSVRLMYLGADQDNGLGMKALLDQKDAALSKELGLQIDASIKAIKDIAGPEGTPFGKAILDVQKRERVLAAQQEVGKLFAMLEQRVLPLMK